MSNVMMVGLDRHAIINSVLIIVILMGYVIMEHVHVIRSSVVSHVIILLVRMVVMGMEIVTKESVNVIMVTLSQTVIRDMSIEGSCIPMVVIYVMRVGLDMPVIRNYVNTIAMIKESVIMEHVLV